MIKRINLVEKKAFSFTYLRLVQVCLAVLVFNVLLVGYQFYNATRLEKKIIVVEQDVKRLEVRRDELTKQPTKKKIAVGQYQELLDKLENTPLWSKFMAEFTERLPNTVWITNLRSSTSLGTVAVEKGAVGKDKKSKSFRKDKDEKAKDGEKVNDQDKIAQSTKQNSFELSGMSSDMRNVTEFASSMAQETLFKNLVLAESNREAYGYTFKIKGEINTNVR